MLLEIILRATLAFIILFIGALLILAAVLRPICYIMLLPIGCAFIYLALELLEGEQT